MDRLEKYRHRYAALAPGWESATARYQQRVADYLTPDVRVLDLGCGRGGIVERLGSIGHWQGVDPDAWSLREHRMPSLPRSCAGAMHLPFAKGAFDLVVASWVLEHLPRPAQTLREIARILRPGGRLVFLTPNARHPLPWLGQRLGRLQRTLVPWVYGRAEADAFPTYYRANTAERLAQLAVQAGLVLRRLEYVEDPSYLAWNVPTFVLAVCLEWLLPAAGKVHLIGECVHMV
ncbi:MAG TPA: class I SAM-dependent methyltransferase [Anaerolineae bacterium]|nr:class I SAM-dependent methyltransferase [Anaerolineae bacterium]